MKFYRETQRKMAKQNKESRCSFCHSGKHETLMLIEGMDAFICDKCVTQANQLLAQELGTKNSKGLQTALTLLKPLEIKQHLDQYVIGQDDAKKGFVCSGL
jgi:ATP-dependent Clp protease ATP-binding subunit ClpX